MIMSLPRKTIAFNRLFQFFALSLSVLPRIHSKGIRGAQIIHRGDLIGDDQVLKNVFSLSLSEVNHPPRDRRNQADNPTNDLQYDFLESCQAALKSEKIVDDGVISQSDFTNFIFDRCLEDKLCKKKDKLKFEHLEVNIQLKFINGVCSQEDSDVRVNCILGLEEMWNNGGEFGLKLSEVNDAMLDDLVEGLCEETYVDVGKMGLIKTWEPIFTPSLFPHFEPNYPATLPQIHVGDPSPEPSTLHPTLSPSIGPAKNTATYNPSYTEPTFKPSLLPTFEPNDPPTPPQILTGVQSPKPSSHYLRSTIGPTFLVSTAPTYNPYHAEPSFIQSSFHTSEPTNTPTLRSNNTGVPSLKAPLLNRTSSPLILSTNTPSYNPARSSRPTSNAPTFSSSTSSPTQPFTVIPDIEEEGEGGTLGPTLNPTALTMLNPLPVRFPTDAANHAYSKQFATECFSYLLSPELLSDDLISQNDFSQFITYHCIQMELCEEGTMLTFEELDVSLQITFILGVCSEDDEESRMTCIDDLRVMWNSDSDFGFDVDLEDIDTLLWNLCANSYGDLLQMGLTTSEAPTITFTPNPSVVPSRAPINEKDQVSFASSTAPSFLSQSQSPNFDLIEVVDDDGDSFKAPETTNRNSSFPVGAIAGATFAAACLLVAACIVSKCRNRYKSSASLNEQSFSKNANHYGTLLQPWDGPLPLAYDMSSNRSWLSTSSSFRDLRFVNVFAPDGVSIPQFNPNTTGAVVIGSVTIGASSSSCSSHFSRNDESSPKSHSYVTIGRIACQADKIQLGTRDNGSGYSSKDDVSSLSSSKSSIACKRSTRRSKLSSITNDTDDKNSILAATSLSIGSRSTVSRRTMPLSRAQRKKMTRKGVSYHREVSFADWKAVSFMSNEVYHFNQATDSAAAIKQKSFFFDVFTSNVSTSSSCEDPLNDLSSQSLKISPRVAGIFPSHNNASSLQSASRLSTADTSSHIDTHRKTMSTNSSSSPLSETNQLALFSQLQNQYIISPDTQSISNEDSDVSSTKIPTPSQPWSNKSFSLLFAQKPKLSTLRSIGFKSMIAACTKEKTKMKRRLWRNRSYHMISGDIGLEEDQSVASMKSYSSRINLLPTGEFAFTARTSLPNILLGTFAAAAVPIGDRTMPLARWKEAENELTTYNVHQEMGSSKLEVRHDEANPNSTDTTFCQPEITPQDSARGDPDSSFSAYSKSDFEGSSSASSASTDKLIEDSPVSNASSNHVTLESEVGGFSVATNSIQCKLSPERAKVAYESELHSRSPQEHVWEETMNDFENSYHIKEGSRVNVSSLGDGTNTMYSSQDGSTASNITTRRDSVHLLGISQILSESDDSGDHFRKMSPPNSVEAMSSNEVISTNTFTQKELESTNGEPVNVSDDSSDQSPKESHRHGCVIVNDLRDDLSFSDGNNSVKQSGDWSDVQIVSRNSSTSSNDDTSDSGFYDGFNDNSLSLSWISGENSAANIIEWAISQEISKGSI